jgi:transcriptional regulator with XRE-family HTH domain
MATVDRALARAAHRFDRQSRDIGDEFRETRLAQGLSQVAVAAAARIARNRYGRIENGRCPNVTLDEATRIATVLGLDLSIRVFPAGPSIRDAGHTHKLTAFLDWVTPPLTHRTEVPLPIVEGRPERRAWDAVLFEHAARGAVELEMRLRDVQAALRRIDLKRRDDPTESFLLLVADTRHNRRVLAEFGNLFVDLPRLRRIDVRRALRKGELPRTGLLLV